MTQVGPCACLDPIHDMRSRFRRTPRIAHRLVTMTCMPVIGLDRESSLEAMWEAFARSRRTVVTHVKTDAGVVRTRVAPQGQQKPAANSKPSRSIAISISSTSTHQPMCCLKAHALWRSTSTAGPRFTAASTCRCLGEGDLSDRLLALFAT